MIYLEVLCIVLFIQFIFAFLAIRLKTDTFTDISYGGTFVLIMFYLLFTYTWWVVHYILFLLITLWWIRLAAYLFMRILIIKKDKRFDWIREKKVSFAKFWTLQAIIIFFLLLAPLVVYTQSNALSLFTFFWSLFSIIWLLIESIADYQKFQAKRQQPHRWVDKWLRAKARHPNYLWEIMMWRGIYIICIPFFQWWQFLTIIWPFSITWLLLFITWIPPLEEQRDRQYGENPEYIHRKNNTNMLIPIKR